MGKKYDAKNPNTAGTSKKDKQAARAKETAARVLKKDCRTCDNTRVVRVVKPRPGLGERSKARYYPPADVKCPDC